MRYTYNPKKKMMIAFAQKITDAEYKKAIAIHYFGYKFTLIGPVLAIFILMMLAIVAIFIPEVFSRSFFILLLLALYLLIRPWIYIQSAFRSTKSNRLSSGEMAIKITDDEKIMVQIDEDTSTLSLKNLHSYRNTKQWIYLYVSKTQYMLLNKRSMQADQVDKVLELLKHLKIKSR